MCALTLSAPVRGTEMGMQLQVQVGVCVPRHELITQPRWSPSSPLLLCVSSSFWVYSELRLRRCSVLLQ